MYGKPSFISYFAMMPCNDTANNGQMGLVLVPNISIEQFYNRLLIHQL